MAQQPQSPSVKARKLNIEQSSVKTSPKTDSNTNSFSPQTVTPPNGPLFGGSLAAIMAAARSKSDKDNASAAFDSSAVDATVQANADEFSKKGGMPRKKMNHPVAKSSPKMSTVRAKTSPKKVKTAAVKKANVKANVKAKAKAAPEKPSPEKVKKEAKVGEF